MTRPPSTSRSRATRDALAAAILEAFEAPGAAGSLDDPVALGAEASAQPLTGRERCARDALATHRADPSALPGALGVAAALLAAGLFFEVHELLEREWRSLGGERRRFYQGLIQVAVALHHLVHDNPQSGARLFAAARDKLTPLAPSFEGVDVATLLAGCAPWERWAHGSKGWPEALELPVLSAVTS